jgi:hypothetical protein
MSMARRTRSGTGLGPGLQKIAPSMPCHNVSSESHEADDNIASNYGIENQKLRSFYVRRMRRYGLSFGDEDHDSDRFGIDEGCKGP